MELAKYKGADYIHEAKLNAVVEAVRRIAPINLQENVIRKGHLKLYSVSDLDFAKYFLHLKPVIKRLDL